MICFLLSRGVNAATLNDSATLRHAFAENSLRLGVATCTKCGQSVFKDSTVTPTSYLFDLGRKSAKL